MCQCTTNPLFWCKNCRRKNKCHSSFVCCKWLILPVLYSHLSNVETESKVVKMPSISLCYPITLQLCVMLLFSLESTSFLSFVWRPNLTISCPCQIRQRKIIPKFRCDIFFLTIINYIIDVKIQCFSFKKRTKFFFVYKKSLKYIDSTNKSVCLDLWPLLT